MNFKSYGRRMVVFLIAAGLTLVAAAGATWADPADVAFDSRPNAVHDADDTGDAQAPLDNDDNPDISRPRGADADDRALTDAEQTMAAAAAVKAVGSGTATEVEASDDFGAAYEGEVIDRVGVEWDVELDASYDVVSKTKDD